MRASPTIFQPVPAGGKDAPLAGPEQLQQQCPRLAVAVVDAGRVRLCCCVATATAGVCHPIGTHCALLREAWYCRRRSHVSSHAGSTYMACTQHAPLSVLLSKCCTQSDL